MLHVYLDFFFASRSRVVVVEHKNEGNKKNRHKHKGGGTAEPKHCVVEFVARVIS